MSRASFGCGSDKRWAEIATIKVTTTVQYVGMYVLYTFCP